MRAARDDAEQDGSEDELGLPSGAMRPSRSPFAGSVGWAPIGPAPSDPASNRSSPRARRLRGAG
eukprot:4491779-Lingulodinium_polyedra.AAC.1